jgi:hypothetical protein
MSRRTETAYKAQSLGKSAQHDKALGLVDTVNAALGVSLWSLTCIAKDHVLIRGDLSDLRSLLRQRPVWQHAG